jgi:hypothetical protein
MKSAYRDRTEPPTDCEKTSFVITIAAGGERQHLYVVAARLEEGVRGAIAQNTCDFLDASEVSARVCKLAKAQTRRD